MITSRLTSGCTDGPINWRNSSGGTLLLSNSVTAVRHISAGKNDNKESGASDSNNLNLDTDNAKVSRFLTQFIVENTIYTEIDRRSNTNNNRDAAGNNQNNTAAAIKTGKNDDLTSNNRINDVQKVSLTKIVKFVRDLRFKFLPS